MNVNKIKIDLQNLGITETDTIIIHSSYKALTGKEKIDGGPQAVIKTFKNLVKKGTLMLPALSYESVTPKKRIFDVLNTPCCVGILPEVMRNSEGVVRSVHPTHSVSVWGKNAKEIAASHIKDFTPVGSNSPFHELKRRKGKIVMLGCGLEPNTSMHGVEEMVVPEYLYGKNYDYELILSDGSRVKTNILSHNFKGAQQRYDKILNVLDKNDYTRGKVLNAECYVLNAEAVWEKALEKLKKNPLYFIDKKGKLK